MKIKHYIVIRFYSSNMMDKEKLFDTTLLLNGVNVFKQYSMIGFLSTSTYCLGISKPIRVPTPPDKIIAIFIYIIVTLKIRQFLF